MDWNKLLTSERRKASSSEASDSRTAHERDHDRILFSTPVRRLADKTQVFPLERNDSVRNRLTHSHEVSNLCRSLGVWLAYNDATFSKDPKLTRSIPTVLSATGLAHDLGNPPFGHRGEYAIQERFRRHTKEVQSFLRPLAFSQQRRFSKSLAASFRICGFARTGPHGF
jgi:dGTPase